MNDLGTLIAWLALMAVLSLMDAAARRRRARSEVPGPAPTGDTPPWERPEPVTPETEAEWRELRPRPVEVDTAPDEEAALPPVIYVPLPSEPEAALERVPPPVEAAAIRERAPRELERRVGPPAPAALSTSEEPRAGGGSRAGRGAEPAQVLRALLSADRAGLRNAVLYREVLGAPLGARRRPGGWEEPAALDDG